MSETKSFSIFPSQCETNAASADVFDNIYTTHFWGSTSRSGGGSELKNVLPTLTQLDKFIIDNNVESFVDIPCGVESWQFASQELNTMKAYFGGDISKNVINPNKEKYQQHPGKVFETWDLTKCKIPKYQMMDDEDNMYRDFDMAMSRDVIMHLSLNDGLKFVKNVVMSDVKYWAVSSFPVESNRDGKGNNQAPNNLMIEPFNLPKENIVMKVRNEQKGRWIKADGYYPDNLIVFKIDEKMKKVVQNYNITE